MTTKSGELVFRIFEGLQRQRHRRQRNDQAPSHSQPARDASKPLRSQNASCVSKPEPPSEVPANAGAFPFCAIVDRAAIMHRNLALASERGTDQGQHSFRRGKDAGNLDFQKRLE